MRHIAKHRENDKTSTETCRWINETRQQGIPAIEQNDIHLLAQQLPDWERKTWILETNL